MTLALAPDDAGLPASLAPLSHLLSRRSAPLARLAVSSINGQPAGDSPYVAVLRVLFEVVREQRGLTLYRGRAAAPQPS